MSALLGDAVLGQNENSVGISDGRQAVGDGEGCSALCEPLKRFLNELFALVIERRGRLVKQQNGRIFQEHARY